MSGPAAITAITVSPICRLPPGSTFTDVRPRRRTREDAAGLAEAFADLLSPLLPVDEPALRTGLRIFLAHPRVGAFDAVLGAAAIAAGADALVSADSAFGTVEGLRHVVPDATGLVTLGL